tara:strand:+ start:6231 stop:6602 length:372 start_codon:yes stop_codon:yes gene_type:complete
MEKTKMTNLTNQIEKSLKRRTIVNSFSIVENTINIDAKLNYLDNISIDINKNDMELVTDININITAIDRRIKEENLKIYPHEFKTEVDLMRMIFSKLTNYNKRIGEEIEALRNQLNLFGDDYE